MWLSSKFGGENAANVSITVALHTLRTTISPTKNLFSKPRPTDLVTVPSCEPCNSSASMDDEYFRTMLAMRRQVGNHPEVKSVLPAVLRSLSNPKKKRFTRSFLRTLRKLPVRTPSGLYAGTAGTYNVDLTRLDAVAARIAKGLFYKERGYRLPDNYEARSFSNDGLRDLDSRTIRDLQETILAPLMAQRTKTIGWEVFEYRVSFAESHPNASAWLFRFYNDVMFLVLTAPRERDSTGACEGQLP